MTRKFVFTSNIRNEILFTIILSFAVIYFTTQSINDLDYFLWPDEGEFLGIAREILYGRKKDVLWGLGGFNEHPAAASLYTASFLYIFGDSLFSFRFASIFACYISIIPIFFTCKLWTNRTAALFGSIAFASSFYIHQFSHCSYNNILIIPVLSITLAFTSFAIKKNSLFALSLAGISAGMGYYTNYFAFFFILFPLLASFIVSVGERGFFKNTLKKTLTVMIPFLIVALPILLNIDIHLRKALVEHAGIASNDQLLTFSLANSLLSLFSFNEKKLQVVLDSLLLPLINRNSGHYVIGRWFDGITALFYIIGLSFAIKSVFKKRFNLNWQIVWLISVFFLCIFGLSITNVYPTLSTTRAIFIVSFIPIFCALGFWEISKFTSENQAIILSFILSALCITLNLKELDNYRIKVTPNSDFALMLKEASKGESILIITDTNWKNHFEFMFSTYPTPKYLNLSFLRSNSINLNSNQEKLECKKCNLLKTKIKNDAPVQIFFQIENWGADGIKAFEEIISELGYEDTNSNYGGWKRYSVLNLIGRTGHL